MNTWIPVVIGNAVTVIVTIITVWLGYRQLRQGQPLVEAQTKAATLASTKDEFEIMERSAAELRLSLKDAQLESQRARTEAAQATSESRATLLKLRDTEDNMRELGVNLKIERERTTELTCKVTALELDNSAKDRIISSLRRRVQTLENKLRAIGQEVPPDEEEPNVQKVAV